LEANKENEKIAILSAQRQSIQKNKGTFCSSRKGRALRF